MKKSLDISSIAKIAILSAISVIVMLFEIPLWFAPPFYKIDLSEVVVLIGGFALGPVNALFIELTKILLNLLINGSDTGGVGELANFLIGASFVFPAAYIYKHKKCIKNAVIGMSVGTIVMTIVGGLINLYLMLPLYASIFGWSIESLVEIGTKINPAINSLYTFVLLATTPFNLIKGVLSSIIAVLLYKKLSPILHKQFTMKNSKGK